MTSTSMQVSKYSQAKNNNRTISLTYRAFREKGFAGQCWDYGCRYWQQSRQVRNQRLPSGEGIRPMLLTEETAHVAKLASLHAYKYVHKCTLYIYMYIHMHINETRNW